MKGILMFAVMAATLMFRAKADDALWSSYRSQYIQNGRVVDGTNGNISHSEGQGYGMLLAEGYGDQQTFDSLWNWTRNNLQVRGRMQLRGDALFAWRWRPDANGGGAVDDMNDASDGDILIAWALVRASDRWQNDSYRQAARQIAQDVRAKLIRPSAFGPVLLPGIKGFEHDSSLVVNLSYWVFPAFRDLAKVDPSPVWRNLELSGQRLVAAAQFGRWGLPPDWLSVQGKEVSVASGFDPVFGYNAARVPLYLAWANVGGTNCGPAFVRFYNETNGAEGIRATVNLQTNVLGKDPALQGMRAIYDLISLQDNQSADTLAHPYATLASDESYFSASLGLLANMASSERRLYAKP
ncbi:MAG: glycosyl hydrolase family 8 [Chthoniobacteraceae bacterium]